jgi:hypothetical protein
MGSFYPLGFDNFSQEHTKDYEDYFKIMKPRDEYSEFLHLSNLLPGTFKVLNIPQELDLMVLSWTFL